VYNLRDEDGPGRPIAYFKDQSLKEMAQKKITLPNGQRVPLIELPKMHVMISRTKVTFHSWMPMFRFIGHDWFLWVWTFGTNRTFRSFAILLFLAIMQAEVPPAHA
jgi:hypothetical protein